MRATYALAMGLAVGVGFSSVQAGWVIEQTTVAAKPSGEAGPAEPATMRVSQGRVRLTQPNAVSVQDCVKERFTLFIPDRNVYWSGTLDQYVAEVRPNLAKPKPTPDVASSRKPRSGKSRADAPPPAIVVRKTDEHAKIGGRDTVKYIIESNGRLFQELWVTTEVNIKDDLDPKRYIACQQKLATVMRGASAADFGALYRSPDYLALTASGYPMKTVVHHRAGTFTREVRSIGRADVPDSDFDIPAGAEKVALKDLFDQTGVR
jgi:hypothetical protein